MKQINCQIDNKVVIVEYIINNGQLLCTNDIEIRGWKIDRRIKIYGGSWKYDDVSYVEFVITDKLDITKIFKVYVNKSNKFINVKSYGYYGWDIFMKDFIENCSLWNCENWHEAMKPAYIICDTQ